jgi:hypothetical protein
MRSGRIRSSRRLGSRVPAGGPPSRRPAPRPDHPLSADAGESEDQKWAEIDMNPGAAMALGLEVAVPATERRLALA